MDKDNQEDSNQYFSADFLKKRKRGRPRKHLRLDSNELNYATPPGYERGGKSRPHQSEDVMVGQPVTGVIEASFEAGYLLSVKVENSESVLRGVVFKPGRCVPVSAENDVAPNVPMIRRNNVPKRTKGRKSRFRKELSPSGVKGRELVPVPVQPAQPAIPKGFLVPVVLQPANLQNGGRVSNHVPDTSKASPNTALPINQAPPVESRNVHSQSESGSQMAPGVMQSGVGRGKPFETLLTEVMKKVQVQQATTPPSAEADSDDQALAIEPLQAIHPVHPVHMPKPLPGYRTGKMTELLQAVQENMRETHVSRGH